MVASRSAPRTGPRSTRRPLKPKADPQGVTRLCCPIIRVSACVSAIPQPVERARRDAREPARCARRNQAKRRPGLHDVLGGRAPLHKRRTRPRPGRHDPGQRRIRRACRRASSSQRASPSESTCANRRDPLAANPGSCPVRPVPAPRANSRPATPLPEQRGETAYGDTTMACASFRPEPQPPGRSASKRGADSRSVLVKSGLRLVSTSRQGFSSTSQPEAGPPTRGQLVHHAMS